MSDRGIIISPTIEISSHEFFISGGVEDQYLRECALYWDVIDYPNPGVIQPNFDDDAEEDINILREEGIFTETEFDLSHQIGSEFTPEKITNAWLIAQHLAIQERLAEGRPWTLGQNSPRLVLPDEHSTEARLAEVELYQAVPVPLGDAPMEEVLGFKETRAAELQRFRETLDSLYNDITSASDIPKTKNQKIMEVEESVADLNQVMEESRLTTTMRTVQAKLSLPEIGSAAITASYDLTAGAAVGIGALVMEIDIQDIIDPVPDDLRDFAYVSHAQDELGPDDA